MQVLSPTFDLEHIHSRLIGNFFSYWYYQGWIPPLHHVQLSVHLQEKWEKGVKVYFFITQPRSIFKYISLLPDSLSSLLLSCHPQGGGGCAGYAYGCSSLPLSHL